MRRGCGTSKDREAQLSGLYFCTILRGILESDDNVIENGPFGIHRQLMARPKPILRADKLLTDALRMEVTIEPRKARRIARKLLQMAEDGDIRAAQLIFERLEGKAPQAPEEYTEAVVTIDERVSRILELQSRVQIEDLEPIAIGLKPDEDQ